MNDKIMNKATFTEICKIMKDDKKDAWECINELFGISLLFLPGLICKETAILTNISNGVGLLSAKKDIEKAIKTISKTFNQKNYSDFSTKYEHAQIAHILIVFAAYFDSIKMYLPNEEKEIELTSKEKYLLTNVAIDKYLKSLEEKAKSKPEAKVKEILEYDLSLPNPIESLDRYSKGLKKFYELLNQEFICFFEQLSFWETLKEEKKDAFLAVIRELPDKAKENYQKQYYELAINFNDFFVWSNIQEHENIQQSIDIGFSDISKQIETYYEKIKDIKAIETLNKYAKKYQSYIEEPIIDTSEMDYDTSGDVVFPAKKDIFIPQKFKALIYKGNLQLENDVWNEYEERENIGKFISDALRHSKVGELPLLILGLPGAGKSLLCSMLAAKLLINEYHVIIIKLRDTIADETISQQISQQMKRDFSNACSWDDIAESGINKPVLLIFDGYDELLQASGRTYSDYIKKIAEFQKEQKGIYNIFVKCIVTSRTTLIDKAFIMDNTPVIRLSDFDEKRINAWSIIWNDYNKNFFQKNQLDFFEVDQGSKIFELAKQPLLLLMLALYDSNGNALKKQKNLNSTQLYYSLIREFISREKKKDHKFRSKQESEQQKIINEEVRKISIAALGMYNRKALYIRSIELQSDIDFIEQRVEDESELRDAELKESDKRIGSFLFIHKSKSTGLVEKERIKDTAYEFLHNTFAEFLTAYFIDCEISKILKWIQVLLNQNMKNKWNLSDHRAWCLCLAYAPLFSRPVVVEMIHEWSDSYLESQGMTKEEIEETMEFLINSEIQRVISGENLFPLKEVIEKKGNPYKQEEILKHLAVYSLNIVILRTIVCASQYTFKFDSEVWNKLVCLWKFAFSNDELSDYANIFIATPKKDVCEIKYDSVSVITSNQQSEVNKLFKSRMAIGDDLTYSIIGALIGNGTKDKIIDGLNHNQLSIKARYMWNFILRDLGEIIYSPYEIIYVLEDYRKYCYKERDVEYIFAYYLLVNFLLKKKFLNYNDKKVKRFLLEDVVIEKALLGRNYLEYVGLRPSFNFYYFILEISLDILDYITLEDDEIERLLREYPNMRFHDRFFYDHNIEFVVRFYSIIIRKLVNRKRNDEFVDCLIKESYLEDNLRRALRSQDIMNNGQEVVGEIIELTYNLMLLEQYSVFEHFLIIFLDYLCHQKYNKQVKTSVKQKIKFIKCIYIIWQNNPSFCYRYNMAINSILKGTTIREILPISEDAVIKLCYLAEKEGILSGEQLRKDIIWIINTKGNQISETFRKEIYSLANSMGITI